MSIIAVECALRVYCSANASLALLFVLCIEDRLLTLVEPERGVMEMAKNSKQTSKAVARKASAALRDGRSSGRTKSIAGSALAQAKPTKR